MKKSKTQPVSARIDSKLVETITQDGLPISRIVEALLRYYSKLDEEQKKKLIIENLDFSSWEKNEYFTVDKLKSVPLATVGLILINPTIVSAVLGLGSTVLLEKALKGIKKLSQKDNDKK